MKCNLEKLVKRSLERIDLSIVGFKDDGEIVISFSGKGVVPLLNFIEENKDNLGKYENLFIGDKVIGKASALLLILLKPRFVFGKVMSRRAKDVLEDNRIRNEYETIVEEILNSDKSDMCPFEKSVLSISKPEEALSIVQETLKQIKAK